MYSPGWYYNEWQAVSIYATDLILLALLIFWAVDKRLAKSFIHRLVYYDYFLLGFLAAALVSVKNSSDFWSSLFLWLKVVEFAAFYFYLKTYAAKKFNFIKIFYALIVGGVFQAVIAIAQFLKQSDLGLRWFGESVLGPHTTGVAAFFVASGEKIIRAYGTTPHPNILASYLFLSIFAFYFLILYSEKKPLIYWTYPLMLVGFFFTFSRTIIFLWVVGISARIVISYFTERFKHQFWDNQLLKTKILRAVWLTIIISAVFAVIYWPEVRSRAVVSSQEEAVRLRIFYNKESLNSGVNLFGIGLGDFTTRLMEQNPNLPRYVYQPVHNIYLLIYSEIGIVGFAFFLLFLVGLTYEFIKKTKLSELWNYSFLLITASVLFIGLFDHFLITLQQGRFIFWLGLTLLSISDIIEQQSERRQIDHARQDKA